ncbi:MAG: hypothetical protein HC831_19445 [Chloroflexia bacterium]|nr:hypothetical protein [Chloroflexia bacterium]
MKKEVKKQEIGTSLRHGRGKEILIVKNICRKHTYTNSNKKYYYFGFKIEIQVLPFAVKPCYKNKQYN